jgi:hypothetical protein
MLTSTVPWHPLPWLALSSPESSLCSSFSMGFSFQVLADHDPEEH